MSRIAQLLRVELPLAWPPILTGIRVSTQMLMGIAAIAAFASGPGLGNEIFRGIASLGSANALNQVLAGTLGIVVLALLFDAAYVLHRTADHPEGDPCLRPSPTADARRGSGTAPAADRRAGATIQLENLTKRYPGSPQPGRGQRQPWRSRRARP